MHFQNLARSDGQKSAGSPGPPPPKSSKRFEPPRHSSRLGVRRKIFFGYTLVIGIAIAGNLIGNLIQHRVEEGALTTFQKANMQSELLLEIRHHSQFLIQRSQNLTSLFENPKVYQNEVTELFQHILTLQQNLLPEVELRQFVSRNEGDENLSGSQKELARLLLNYERQLTKYVENLKEILKRANTNDPSERQVAKQELLRLLDGPLASSLDFSIDDLERAIQNYKEKQREASENLRQAGNLGAKLYALVSVLSLLLALGLGILTSFAIARPLSTATQIANRVTRESDFSLQIPVVDRDEIGILSETINQLVRRVAEYTSEMQQSQAHLVQNEKMMSLGQMVAGIAHEINNPANFIYGNLIHTTSYVKDLIFVLELYQAEYPESTEEIQEAEEEADLEFLVDDLPKMLESMTSGVERIRQIVLSLRNFSRLDESTVKIVNIHAGIESTLLLLNYKLRGIEVKKEFGDLPLVECYPAQLNQVWMNLLENAIDALEIAGVAKPQILIRTEEVSRDRVRVKICDNGCGIPEDRVQRIFDPFFTTKPVGKGTGLGLAICYQVVCDHGGAIGVRSELDEGTEVSVTTATRLPLARRKSL